MCDTMVIRATKAKPFLFGKNSDRDPQEPQMIQYVNASEGINHLTHPESRPPYNSVQYRQTILAYETLNNNLKALICRPAWIWGAEMGINEKGVAIGNEALFSKSKVERTGLLGMDILRLALHNSGSAQEAVEVITTLIERFGQGGNGSYNGVLKYHNSFLISDKSEAWIVETARRKWVAKQVEKIGTISNAYQIGEEYEKGDQETLLSRPHFSKKHASSLHEFFSKGRYRQKESLRLLEEGKASWNTIADTLRAQIGSIGYPDHSMKSINMDAKGVVTSRTTSSMIVEYIGSAPLVWLTGSPLPSYSPFLPFSIEESAFSKSPFSSLEFAYRFSKERTDLSNLILIAPPRAKEAIHAAALECEQACRSLVEQKEIIEGPLVKEQEFRERVVAILKEHDIDSTSLIGEVDRFFSRT